MAETPRYFSILNMNPKFEVSPGQILEKFAEAALLEATALDGTRLAELVEAYRVVTAPGARATYLELGHEAYVARNPVIPDPFPDAVREVVIACADFGSVHRIGEESARRCMGGAVSSVLEQLPVYLSHDRLRGIPDIETVGEISAALFEVCDEFVDFARNPWMLEWAWRAKCPLTNGKMILGKAAKIPAQERGLRDPGQREREKERQLGRHGRETRVPLFRITLSLEYWLVANPGERMRLVHHEIMHCEPYEHEGQWKGKMRHHDVEEFVLTAARYGPLDDTQRNLAAALKGERVVIDGEDLVTRQEGLFEH